MKQAFMAATAVVLSVAAAAHPVHAQSGNPSCVYRSEKFSEGAAICIQKGLMLSCTASGERLVWKVTREAGLSDLCVAGRDRLQRKPHVARRFSRPARPASISSNAKCFVFNGKTYCE